MKYTQISEILHVLSSSICDMQRNACTEKVMSAHKKNRARRDGSKEGNRQSQGLHATVISSSSAQHNYDSSGDLGSWGVGTGVDKFITIHVIHVHSQCILCSSVYLIL